MSVDLEELFNRAAPSPASPPPLPRVKRRGRRLLWRDRLFASAAVLVLCLGTLSLIPDLTSDRPSRPARPPSLSPPSLAFTTSVEPGITDIASGFGSTWVPGPEGLWRLNEVTGETESKLPLSGIDDNSKVAVGFGSVWVTHDVSEVSRIDPDTNKIVATIDIGPGRARGITTGGGSVWVTREPLPTERDGYLVEISPTTVSVVGEPVPVGASPGSVIYAGGAAWVTLTYSSGFLIKVDPISDKKVGEIAGTRGSAALVDGDIWAATGDSVLVIDAATAEVRTEYPISGAWDVDFANGSAWVLTLTGSRSENIYLPDPSEPSLLIKLDPKSGTQVGNGIAVGNSPNYLAAGTVGAWVAAYDAGEVTGAFP